MAKRKRKKSGIDHQTCPRCGGRWVRTSGFHTCQSCGFKHGDQMHIRASGQNRVEPSLAEERMPTDLPDPGRRYDHGLKFR